MNRIARQGQVIEEQIRSLREKQEEFTSITENMSEGFLVLDRNTDILSYNTSALRLLGAEAAPAESHVSALALNRRAPASAAPWTPPSPAPGGSSCCGRTAAAAR